MTLRIVAQMVPFQRYPDSEASLTARYADNIHDLAPHRSVTAPVIGGKLHDNVLAHGNGADVAVGEAGRHFHTPVAGGGIKPGEDFAGTDTGARAERLEVTDDRPRRDGQLARYQQTVLEALEETENALAGFRTANQAEDELRLGAAAASEAARLARRRYEVGAGDYLSVLIAERQKLDFEDQHVQAETRRATALAAVYKALAGDF